MLTMRRWNKEGKDMIVEFNFVAPLKVPKTKTKDFILNLNNYRNAHYMVLNNTKIAFCEIMDERYPEDYKPAPGEVRTSYTVYAASKRKFDLPNVCSIVQKYFEDWLQHKGIITGDDVSIIKECTYIYGGLDKRNPRVEISVEWEE